MTSVALESASLFLTYFVPTVRCMRRQIGLIFVLPALHLCFPGIPYWGLKLKVGVKHPLGDIFTYCRLACTSARRSGSLGALLRLYQHPRNMPYRNSQNVGVDSSRDRSPRNVKSSTLRSVTHTQADLKIRTPSNTFDDVSTCNFKLFICCHDFTGCRVSHQRARLVQGRR